MTQGSSIVEGICSLCPFIYSQIKLFMARSLAKLFHLQETIALYQNFARRWHFLMLGTVTLKILHLWNSGLWGKSPHTVLFLDVTVQSILVGPEKPRMAHVSVLLRVLTSTCDNSERGRCWITSWLERSRKRKSLEK